MKAMRYVFSYMMVDNVVEFTHPDGPEKSTQEWANRHLKAHDRAVAENQRGRAILVEVFDSDVPLERNYTRPAPIQRK